MRNFTLGFMVAMLIAMFIVVYYPTPEPDFVCEGCGSMHWYSVMAEGDEQMADARFNQIAKEMGHGYYECQECKGTSVSEMGFLLLCEDCEDTTTILLKENK